MNQYTDIPCDADAELTVHIDRSHPEANVRYSYTANESDHEGTPFQTADMPWNDQEAARMVNDWLATCAGGW